MHRALILCVLVLWSLPVPRVAALQVMLLPEGQEQPAAAPVELCHGERFRLLVLAERGEKDRHLYVLHAEGAGKVQVLLPDKPERPLLLREGIQRIPEGKTPEEDAFSLEDAGGLEHLFLLASPTPLTFAQAEELAAKALRDDREPLRPPPRVCATTAPKLAPPGQLGRWRRLVLQRGTRAPAGLRPVHLVIFHR